jgi:hypothetical protein
MPTTRGRLVFNNLVVYDQADFFGLDGYSRVPGLTPSQLVLQVYHDNTLQTWTLISGAGVSEGQVASGHVYFDTLTGGAYGVRWRPNAIGYWRILLIYSVGAQILAQDYDVGSGTGVVPPGGGLKVSFVGAGGKTSDC